MDQVILYAQAAGWVDHYRPDSVADARQFIMKHAKQYPCFWGRAVNAPSWTSMPQSLALTSAALLVDGAMHLMMTEPGVDPARAAASYNRYQAWLDWAREGRERSGSVTK